MVTHKTKLVTQYTHWLIIKQNWLLNTHIGES